MATLNVNIYVGPSEFEFRSLESMKKKALRLERKI